MFKLFDQIPMGSVGIDKAEDNILDQYKPNQTGSCTVQGLGIFPEATSQGTNSQVATSQVTVSQVIISQVATSQVTISQVETSQVTISQLATSQMCKFPSGNFKQG